MKLQDIVISCKEDEKKKSLYYKCSGSIKEEAGKLWMEKGTTLSFGTYFNGFSIAKWRKYTATEQYRVAVKGNGRIKISLYQSYLEEERAVTKLLLDAELGLSEKESSGIGIPVTVTKGICYPVVEALSDQAVISEISYEGQCYGKIRENIMLAVDICTFKREPYVKRNIEQISKNILENPASPLYGKTEVFISDNASTLGDSLKGYSHVKVMPNENVGGVGGFTRGMLEAMKKESITHILIMDDDAVIETSALERTYQFLSLLKEEYYNYTIGGELLRENTPWIQYEAGAVWKRGRIKALHHHLNLKNMKDLLKNEEEETIEYAGWWYSCIPVTQIKEYGLPLPLFIHRDDIEYGLRTGRERFIFLNGIGVWHEAFENKMPGANEYYDWRNLAIVNSIHYKDYSKKELFMFLLKWVTANVIRYRYRYVDLNLRGIEDFLKGIDWLKAQDAQKLHGKISKMNYQGKKAEEYIGYQGITKEDIAWEQIEKVEPREIGKWEKLFQRITFNGYLLPAKKGKVLIAMPHDNIYDMYRQKEILYVDSNGNAFLMKRSRKEALKCFQKLWKIKRLLDKNFRQRKQEYATRYTELTEENFWKSYLKMDKGEFHGQEN